MWSAIYRARYFIPGYVTEDGSSHARKADLEPEKQHYSHAKNRRTY